MKISYNVLKKYIPNITDVETVAQDLIMHTAEVEEISYEWEHLSQVYIGQVISCEKHPDSDKLNCAKVAVNGQELSIVCGAPNVMAGIKVPVAVVWAQLTPDFIIKKTKIRGETSEWMICSEDELGLTTIRQEWIFILPDDAPLGASMREYLWKNDAILEVDNKAINHRPDLFSHIGIIREICAIAWQKFDFDYAEYDFSALPSLSLKNEIPHEVSRYTATAVSDVQNIASPKHILQVLNSAECESKGLLVDVSNYSLYLYGQPTHCFDADKIVWDITIRYAEADEEFIGLNDITYSLQETDIVIADSEKVLALGWIIGGKSSAVSDTTTQIVIEWAHFNQATLRQTGKRIGLRTDALNVFEKDIQPDMADKWVALIINELRSAFPDMSLIAHADSYHHPQKQITVPYTPESINTLIGKNYQPDTFDSILENLWIEKIWDILSIPFWRKDLNYSADIAEEIARIDGYNNIETTVPRMNLGAVVQTPIYTLKKDIRDFFTLRGYFDIYSYSFVNAELMEKLSETTDDLVPMKNALSEELTHLRGSLIPHLLTTLEKNKHDIKNMKLFELEKVFHQISESETSEYYSLAGVHTSQADIPYYEIQSEISDMMQWLGITKFHFQSSESLPNYAHKARSAVIIARGQEIGIVWEIHPKTAKNFWMNERIAFFEIRADKLAEMTWSIAKTKEISEFQMNQFDLNFVIDQTTQGRDIQTAIEKTDQNLIQKAELFDIFESADKLPGKRSISFKIYIQSLEETLNDTVKNTLIDQIVRNVAKKWGALR